MTEQVETSTSKQTIAPEIPRGDWDILIILQRHGRYDSGRPQDMQNITSEERASLGRLTEVGRVEVAQRARERLNAILEQDPQNTDILVVNSPTYWLDVEEFGQRAVETAGIISGVISEELSQRELNPDQFLNRSDRIKGERGRHHEGLREADFFDFPEYTAFMREKYKGQGPDFWIARNSDADQVAREGFGAPGPEDDADQIDRVVAAENRFARMYHSRPENQGRRLVIWNVTHGDGLEPYTERRLGIGPEYFIAGYNDGVTIAIDNEGNAIARAKDKQFLVTVPSRY